MHMMEWLLRSRARQEALSAEAVSRMVIQEPLPTQDPGGDAPPHALAENARRPTPSASAKDGRDQVFSRPRRNFGRHCQFSDVDARLLAVVPARDKTAPQYIDGFCDESNDFGAMCAGHTQQKPRRSLGIPAPHHLRIRHARP